MVAAYYDYHFPLALWNLLGNLAVQKQVGPSTAVPDPASREWYSQARPLSSATVEVVTVNYKLPLSLSFISFEVLRVPCKVEVWYKDRSNNWRPVLDESRVAVGFNVDGSNVKAWYKYATSVYPIVAKAVQYRFKRRNDSSLGNQPVVMGMRNGLMRRNVYNRAAGIAYLEDEQDPVGNVISKYVRDWDAAKAVDEKPATFWKSAPMPDPLAVTSLYLDVRDVTGNAIKVDRLYIDPVYTGQTLNIYYSNDDSVGTRKPSPVALTPELETNMDWRPNRGRYDLVTDISSGTNSYYRAKLAVGPLIRKPSWIGVEWFPYFASNNAPAGNCYLAYNYVAGGTTGRRPHLYYSPSTKKFVLYFADGVNANIVYYSSTLARDFEKNEQLRIVAGWRYSPTKTVYMNVVDRTGAVLAYLTWNASNLPENVLWDGQISMLNPRGRFGSHIVKIEDWATSSDKYLKNPTSYVSPDPALPTQSGRIPATSLDNSIYYADWMLQQHGCGGGHDSHYDDKEWTPIWRDYITEKGVMIFPQSCMAKYIKLEFTNLTEQPYPIWESGIDVQYKVFPVSVMQQSSQGPRLYTGTGGFLGLGTFLSLNGVRSVNWLNPSSIADAVNAVFGRTTEPVVIQAGPGFVTDSLPNMGAKNVSKEYRVEATSEYVYRREQLSPYVLAQNATEAIVKAEGISKIADYTDVPWQAIEAANPGAISHKKSAGALPIRGTDWWIFPGQTLKIPANIMQKLTSTSTVLERKLTSESRVRFNTTSVHRYETRTVRRDAAIAYFAGVREVFPLTTNYIDRSDSPEYKFTHYDPAQWVFKNVWQIRPVDPLNALTETQELIVTWLAAQRDAQSGQQVLDGLLSDDPNLVLALGTVLSELATLLKKNIVRRVRGADDFLYSNLVDPDKLIAGPISSPGNPYRIINDSFVISLHDWTTVGSWSHDTTQGFAGLSTRGCAKLVKAGTAASITSKPVPIADNAALIASAWVRWDGATSSAGAKIRLRLLTYDSAGTYLGTVNLTDLGSTYPLAPDAPPEITAPSGNNGSTTLFRLMSGGYTFGSGVAAVALQVYFDAGISAGDFYVDSAWLYPFEAPAAKVFKKFQTQSKFAKMRLDFNDSGPVRSDSMWESSGSDKPAYYVEMTAIPPGFWGDFQAKWTDETITWGEVWPLVSVNVDPDRQYDGRRVLHFRREASNSNLTVPQAGMKVRQWTNMVGRGLFRVGVVLYKPYANNNEAILRFRRVSDGVILYEESVKPDVGGWWEYHSRWVQLPEGPDQVYNVELTLKGNAADEVYVSDLYTEVSHIRYFCQLGSGTAKVFHEVTDLRNATGGNAGSAVVTSTKPVSEFTLRTWILSPKAWAYGVTATPSYLR